MRRQAELVHERAKLADIIITTALIPGRPAPVLISEETVKAMKPGSVIVDLAVEQGGNCPLSEIGKTVTKYGVHIIGEPNLATLVADAKRHGLRISPSWFWNRIGFARWRVTRFCVSACATSAACGVRTASGLSPKG